VLVLGPWMLITGQSGGLTRDWLMTLSWVINIVVAEVIIRRRASAPRASAPATPSLEIQLPLASRPHG
jgi:hypothetical protein